MGGSARERMTSSLSSLGFVSIYPAIRLEGDDPPTWTLVIENWLGYSMTTLVLEWGGKTVNAKDTRVELAKGEVWRVELRDHSALLAYYYMKRKPSDQDIPLRLSWTGPDGDVRSFKDKAYIGGGPLPGWDFGL